MQRFLDHKKATELHMNFLKGNVTTFAMRVYS